MKNRSTQIHQRFSPVKSTFSIRTVWAEALQLLHRHNPDMNVGDRSVRSKAEVRTKTLLRISGIHVGDRSVRSKAEVRTKVVLSIPDIHVRDLKAKSKTALAKHAGSREFLRTLLTMIFYFYSLFSFAQTKAIKSQIPFEGLDQTWQNGSDRRDSALIQNKYFTGTVMLDANYTHSFVNPIDNTVVGSTALARDNEMEVSSANFGGDFYYKNARARIVTQFGTRTTIVPRNDYSPFRGQYDLPTVYRYLSEAYAGYHFDILHGINIDAGMFMSYIGLNSYYQVENWEYQASFTSDNTPWFFNGVRFQIFPNEKLKIEPWIINGWQSYAKFNKSPGIGGNITWCPNSNIKLLTNDYYGTDAAGLPGRHRFHSDNSFLARYFNRADSKKISKAAFSLTADIGFEKGDGVNGFRSDSILGPAQNFVSVMFYNRVWFYKNKFAWTIGGGLMTNPGRYLILYPTGDASPLPNPNNPTTTAGTHPFSANPGDQFQGWDCSTNVDWMPNQSFTFRVEYVHRESSVPYFAGHGGVTSPTGYTTTPLPSNWAPDLIKSENRIILCVLFRI